MDKDKVIYTIQTYHKNENAKHDYDVLDDERCPGFFFEESDARKCLEEDWYDLFEMTYEYALICQVREGCYVGEELAWYRYDNESKGYKEIERPDFIPEYLLYGAIN